MTREQYLNPPRTGTRHCETHEEWLLRAINMLSWYFNEIDRPLPDITKLRIRLLNVSNTLGPYPEK